MGLGDPLPQLRRLRFLRLAARLHASLELGDVPGMVVSAPDKAPDEHPDDRGSGHEAYKKQREQKFEHRHVGKCSAESGYKQAR